MTPNFTANWFDDHIPEWEKHLAVFKGKDYLSFLEIGSFEGRSALWTLENILTGKNCKIVCIDTFQGSAEHPDMNVDTNGIYRRFHENLKLHSDKVIVGQGVSQELLREMKLDTFDFIYIDGSHKASDVLEDAVLSWRLLKQGGIMCFDDYFWSHFSNRYHEEGKEVDPDAQLQEPRIAIEAFIQVFRTQYEIIGAKEQVFLKKL